MALDDRKKEILRAIVEGYIKNAEPVGSRSIAKNTDLNLSAATIRNEMGDLEEMGLLIQPHTSAGRVPSSMGFRFYVDSLMQKYRMTAAEIENMRSAMFHKMRELDKIVKDVSSVFSNITSLPTFGMLPAVEYGTIKSIKLVSIDDRTLMVIVADNCGLIKNKLLRLREGVAEEAIEEMNRVLNENLSGMVGSEIRLENIKKKKKAVGENIEIMSSVLKLVHEAISEIDKREVFMEGSSNILRFPEYNDIEKIKEIIGLFDDKEQLNDILRTLHTDNKAGVQIYIGDENKAPQLKNNSIIFSTYNAGPNMTGVIGVIGPVRMNYAKVVSGVEFFSKQLSEMLSNGLEGGIPPGLNPKNELQDKGEES